MEMGENLKADIPKTYVFMMKNETIGAGEGKDGLKSRRRRRKNG